MKLCDVCSSQLMRVVLEPKVALTNRHTHTHTRTDTQTSSQYMCYVIKQHSLEVANEERT